MKRVLGFLGLLLFVMAPLLAQDTVSPPGDTVAAPTPDATAEPTGSAVAEPLADTAADAPPLASTDAGAEAPFVVICEIKDEIDEGLTVVVERAVKKAENAEALLFVINTPGGRVDSAIEIATSIMSVECPTIAYVEGMGAISGGALVSYACDYIYMAAGSNIGASTPIMPGVETTAEMDEKSNSFVRAKYRALAEANGHDPLLGEAMVDRNMELRAYRNEDGTYTIFEVDPEKREQLSTSNGDVLDKILDAVTEGEGNEEIGDLLRKVLGAGEDGQRALPPADEAEQGAYREFLNNQTELVSARGELLTMTSEEAVHFGLAKSITTDIDDTLREHLLGSVARLEITPTWEEALYAFLTSPTIAGLLLMAGLGGIYVEVRTPGFGAPGIIGAACLALFFGSHMVLGMADWIDLALIAAGFLLILAEIFLLPGFGLAGVLGFACLIGGSYLALVEAPIPEFAWQFDDMYQALYTICLGMFSFIAFVVVSGFLLPYTPLGSALVLRTSLDPETGYTAQTAEESETAVGLRGVALSKLRPAGKGRFGDRKLDVVTRGEFLEENTQVKIISSDGNRYVVARVDE